MNMTTFGFLGRLMKNTLLIKLVLVYSTIMLVPLLLTIYTITEHVNAKMVELEIEKQNDLANKMSTYIDEQYTKIQNIVFWFYSTGEYTQSMVDMLVESGKNDSAYPAYIIKNRITSELNKIVLWDKEILDIILIGTNKDVFSTSKRSISASYDFPNNHLMKQLHPSDQQMYKYPSSHLDYILSNNVPVISHTGNLFDPNNLQDIRTAGQYIINLSSMEILKNYRQFAGSFDASLYLVRTDGMIVFSNNPESIGSNYSFLDQVRNMKSHESNLGGEMYILNKSELSDYSLTIIVQQPKKNITKETNVLIRQIVAIFFIGVLIVLLLTLLFSTNIAYRIKRLLKAMRQLEKGDFHVYVNTNSRDELGQLTTAFNRMCLKLKDHVDMVYLAEIKTKSAELSSLQARINPHFLLNTIESIRMKAVQEHSTEISHMLYTLGKLFRWKVRSTDLIITIEEEIEYISSYLLLLQFRFQELDVKVNIDEDMYELGIPKLLLQPIIENAIQHGLFHKSQQSRLSIRGYREQHQVIFEVIDNGVGIEEPVLKEIMIQLEQARDSSNAYHIGLSNVQQRIRILFGEPYGLTVTSKKNYWTRIKIILPAMTKKEMDSLVPNFHR